MYLIFWVGTDPYMLTVEVGRTYRWSKSDSWEEYIYRDIFEVWFSYLYGYWRPRLFSVLVTLEDKVFPRFW